jgi:hypothetical protein
MFHTSACSATTRSVAAERPPITIGGCGRWTGLGLPNAPVSWWWVPSKSNGAASVHRLRMTVHASRRLATESVKSS